MKYISRRNINAKITMVRDEETLSTPLTTKEKNGNSPPQNPQDKMVFLGKIY